MKIERATKKDRPSIRVLIRANAGTLLQDHLPRSKQFFVARHKAEVSGCCALVVYSRKLAEIRSLAVAEAFQGNGLATKLIKACMREAKRRHVHEVLSITGAEELFRQHGFSSFKREKLAMLKVLDDE